MKLERQDQEFIEALAKSETGRSLCRLLENIERYHADIRNLNGVDPKVRVDALSLLRESLLDKLLVLAGEKQPPNSDEYH